MTRKRTLLAAAALIISASSAAAAPKISAAIAAAIADPTRPAADTVRDAARKPAEMLVFAGVKPGLKVVDLLPGGGYFTRIFAKAVGPKGFVYAYFGLQYDVRIKSQGGDPNNQFATLTVAYPNLGIIHGPLASFVTPEPVDIVWTSDNYHDLHNKAFGPVDMMAMNKAIYASLKPGGLFVVVDHRAAPGSGVETTEQLHRIDEAIATREIEAAGFKLIAQSNALRNPADDNTKRIFDADEHDHTDQFMLKFQKPLH